MRDTLLAVIVEQEADSGKGLQYVQLTRRQYEFIGFSPILKGELWTRAKYHLEKSLFWGLFLLCLFV